MNCGSPSFGPGGAFTIIGALSTEAKQVTAIHNVMDKNTPDNKPPMRPGELCTPTRIVFLDAAGAVVSSNILRPAERCCSGGGVVWGKCCANMASTFKGATLVLEVTTTTNE